MKPLFLSLSRETLLIEDSATDVLSTLFQSFHNTKII